MIFRVENELILRKTSIEIRNFEALLKSERRFNY